MRDFPNIRNSYIEEEKLYNNEIAVKLNDIDSTHLLDSAGDYHGTQHEKWVYEFNGIDGKITSPHIINQTVVSYDGTSTITVATGELQFTAGWATNILLSDGTFYKCEEQAGVTAFDSSGNGNHGTLTGGITHTTVREAGVVNYTNEVGYTNNGGIIVPRVGDTLLDAEGNPLQFVGKVASDMLLLNSNCIEVDNTTEAQFNFDCTGLTITSFEGTATPTFDTANNKITFTTGTFYNLVLSNGYHFPIAEGLGTTSYRALDETKKITWVGTATWTTQDSYHYNINNGFSGANGGVKYPFKGLVKVEDYPWTWIFGNGGTGFYSNWKDNLFLPSTDSTIEVGDKVDYDSVNIISLNNQNLTTDFTDDFLDKFNNLNIIHLMNNNIQTLDLQSVNIEDLRISNNNIVVSSLESQSDLELFYADNCNLSNINFTSFPNLRRVFAVGNNFVNADFSNSAEIQNLRMNNNVLLSILNVNNCSVLKEIQVNNSLLTSINTQDCVNLRTIYAENSEVSNLDFSNNPLLSNIRLLNSKLDANTNSNLLVQIDNHGLSGGYFRSTIFGGGSLTAAGQAAKLSLESKGWEVIGI